MQAQVFRVTLRKIFCFFFRNELKKNSVKQMAKRLYKCFAY